MLIPWLGSLRSGTLGLQDSLIGGKEGMVLNPFTEVVKGAEGEVRASPLSAHPSFNQIPCKLPAGRQQSKKPCAALQPTQKTPLPPCRGSISPLGGQDQKMKFASSLCTCCIGHIPLSCCNFPISSIHFPFAVCFPHLCICTYNLHKSLLGPGLLWELWSAFSVSNY